MSEEYDTDEHRKDMLDFIAPVEAEFDDDFDNPTFKRSLNEAGYTMSELNLWHDLEGGLTSEAIIQAWALIETLRRNGGKFPPKLRM
ncbi:hypothetical protein CcrC1_gp439 [Caulobacter phage C1]|nr:hypothetical protein CcrC1_gp439 [Caulobacter phage C1]UTU08668.1 hypothetical protein CcrC2_gp440 [Caulobacter phage C2]WGN97334.1 hypothetical protein [Bertelyvirus sp.]WGN97853.1 hypothetical protein [Bertelyvirus sp.]